MTLHATSLTPARTALYTCARALGFREQVQPHDLARHLAHARAHRLVHLRPRLGR